MIVSENQRLSLPFMDERGVELFMKREDELDPVVSGNKWRKLKYNLLAAKESGCSTVVSFGGAYSNHILAVAKAARDSGLNCVLKIRGDAFDPSNPTLVRVKSFGAECQFLSRDEYRILREEPVESSSKSVFVIPEGGSNAYGIKGCGEILGESESDFDVICCPQGTGGTVAGLLCGLKPFQRLISFPVLKGDFFRSDIQRLLEEAGQEVSALIASLEIDQEAHYGGYAKWDKDLIDFMRNFYRQHHIKLDPIYTSKMMFRLHQRIANGDFKKGTRILAIHTGGLQGIEGFEQRFGFKIYDDLN